MLTAMQIDRMEDAIGESDNCSDNECGCHRAANLAKMILADEENYEAYEDVYGV